MRRKSFCLMSCLFMLLASSSAQHKTDLPDSAFYNLDIPKVWQDKRMLFSLTGLIKDKMFLIGDKKVCIGCTDGSYTVSFFVGRPVLSNPVITDVTKADENKSAKYQCAVLYYFFASLVLKKDGQKLDEFILVDSSETFRKEKIFDVAGGQSYPVNNARLRRSQTGTVVTRSNNAATPVAAPGIFDPEKFKNDHEKEMQPDNKELRVLLLNKIHEFGLTAKK